MVLGDAFQLWRPGPSGAERILRARRSGDFLNPEPETVWDTGDSEMKTGAYCTHKQTCNSVKHVERVLDDLEVE